MPSSTITSKGQVTIPLRVRADMKLAIGDRIDFVRMENGHYAIVPASCSIRSLKGIVLRPERPVSLDDMQEAIEASRSAR